MLALSIVPRLVFPPSSATGLLAHKSRRFTGEVFRSIKPLASEYFFESSKYDVIGAVIGTVGVTVISNSSNFY